MKHLMSCLSCLIILGEIVCNCACFFNIFLKGEWTDESPDLEDIDRDDEVLVTYQTIKP